MSRLIFSLLGRLQIEHSELGAITLTNRKAIGLLAYLLIESEHAHSREVLLGLLWPDLPTAAAQNNLRVTWAQLQKTLAWGVVPFTISLPLSVEMVVAGREKRVLLATLAVLVGTAVLTTVGFVQYGLLGLAVGLVVGEWLLAVALFAAVQNRF